MQFIVKSKKTNYLDSYKIDVDIADDFIKKLLGLMFKKEIQRSMIFLNCKQIHTFFMKIPIDVYYVDKNMMVIDLEKSIEPNKIGKYVKESYALIETCSKLNEFEIGDIIRPE